MKRARRSTGVAVFAISSILGLAGCGHAPGAAASTDGSQYLGGPLHSSTNSTTVVTQANAASLRQKWVFHAGAATISGQPNPGFVASPTVSGGLVYVGSDSGVFYAVDESTGLAKWNAFLGFEPKLTCASGRGIASTAAVVPDPVTSLPTVYVAGGDGYLYALDAANGHQNWKSVIALPSPTANDYYDWSSPTVAGGKIYIGFTSECDVPLVRGGVNEYDQATGKLLGTFFSVPGGNLGGGVWSSAAVNSAAKAFVTTGNTSKTAPGDGQSIVSLDGTKALARLDGWRVPNSQLKGDDDFGASPTFFMANVGGTPTQMVGACNKNGVFYALRADKLALGPVWTFRVAAPSRAGSQACLAAPTWDGAHLYVAGGATTINGTIFAGSVTRLNPDTGAPTWQLGLNSVVLGSPSLNGAGVLAAATYGKGVTDGVYLINAATGSIISFLATGKEFSQPVFGDTYLLVASKNNLMAYGP